MTLKGKRDTMNQETTYLALIIDSLHKKSLILDELLTLTTKQEGLLKANNIEDGQFDSTIAEKENLINGLSQQDDGFEKIYQRVREMILNNSMLYQEQITQMRELIKAITDKSVMLQSLEKRNRLQFENVILSKRNEIKKARVSGKAVSNYYKSMANQKLDDSLFLDKKK